jgi:hypothetical protein
VYLKVLYVVVGDFSLPFVLSIENTFHLPGDAPLKLNENAVVLTTGFLDGLPYATA